MTNEKQLQNQKNSRSFWKRLADLFSEFIHQCSTASPLEIVNIEKQAKDETIFFVKLAGKNIIIKKTASELLDDGDLLSGLSRQDLFKVLSEAEGTEWRSRLRLVEKTFDDRGVNITLVDSSSNERLVVALSEISNRAEIFDRLSPQDAFRLGFLSAINTVK